MKKKLYIIVSIVCLLIIGNVFFIKNIHNSNPNNTFQSKVNNHISLENKKDSTAIIKIDNSIITKADLEQARIFRDDNISDEELKNILIDEKILQLEADKRNIKVSDEEVKKLITENKELVNSDSEAKAQIAIICKSMNVSEDVYWNEIVFDSYTEIIKIGKMKDQLLNNNKDYQKSLKSSSNNQSQSTDDTSLSPDEESKLLSTEIEKIKKNYKIEKL